MSDNEPDEPDTKDEEDEEEEEEDEEEEEEEEEEEGADEEEEVLEEPDEEEDEEEEEEDDDEEDADEDEDAEEDGGGIGGSRSVKINDDEDDDDDDDDDDMNDNYLQKINDEMSSDIISNNHPELKSHNAEEIEVMCRVIRNTNGTIIDPLHTTLPFLTRYEIANILGNRAVQIESGATPFVEVKDNIIDSYLIAMSEFKQKKIPYIIRRPLPNGGSEYWKFADLEQL